MTTPDRDRQSHFAALRQKAVADMADLGVTADFIPVLVETFYGRVQAHPELGPVFEARLAGRWPAHVRAMPEAVGRWLLAQGVPWRGASP